MKSQWVTWPVYPPPRTTTSPVAGQASNQQSPLQQLFMSRMWSYGTSVFTFLDWKARFVHPASQVWFLALCRSAWPLQLQLAGLCRVRPCPFWARQQDCFLAFKHDPAARKSYWRVYFLKSLLSKCLLQEKDWHPVCLRRHCILLDHVSFCAFAFAFFLLRTIGHTNFHFLCVFDSQLLVIGLPANAVFFAPIHVPTL